jgi:hypothetical protein
VKGEFLSSLFPLHSSQRDSLHVREQDHRPGSSAAEVAQRDRLRLRLRLRLRKTLDLNLNLHLFGFLIPTLGKKREE